MNRDLRIDFLRGLVLLWIVADHVFNNETRWFVSNDWVFFDCAAGFVFMSGLVCGMVYSRVLDKSGWRATQMKALKRGGQLYLAQLSVFTAVVGIVAVAETWQRVDPQFGLDALFGHPVEALPRVLLLTYTPWLLDILKLYIVLVLALPSILWLYSRTRVGALALSFAAYCFAQRFPEVSPREYPHGLPWFWNPFGWQILFVAGAAIGFERARGILRIPRHPLFTGLAGALMVVLMYLAHEHVLHGGWTDRQQLGPAHVVSFFTFAYLVSGLLQPQWAFWNSRIAQPVVRCGQHSLLVFCSSVVIGYVMSLVLIPIHNEVLEALIIAGGVGTAMLVGTIASLRQAQIGLKQAQGRPAASPRAIPATIAGEERPSVLVHAGVRLNGNAVVRKSPVPAGLSPQREPAVPV